MRTAAVRGRHRLGTPGLVHCMRHLGVASALAECHRGWLWTLLTPARHSLAGLRRRAMAAAAQQAWTPRTGVSAPSYT
jgi:hypothetical protein